MAARPPPGGDGDGGRTVHQRLSAAEDAEFRARIQLRLAREDVGAEEERTNAIFARDPPEAEWNAAAGELQAAYTARDEAERELARARRALDEAAADARAYYRELHDSDPPRPPRRGNFEPDDEGWINMRPGAKRPRGDEPRPRGGARVGGGLRGACHALGKRTGGGKRPREEPGAAASSSLGAEKEHIMRVFLAEHERWLAFMAALAANPSAPAATHRAFEAATDDIQDLMTKTRPHFTDEEWERLRAYAKDSM